MRQELEAARGASAAAQARLVEEIAALKKDNAALAGVRTGLEVRLDHMAGDVERLSRELRDRTDLLHRALSHQSAGETVPYDMRWAPPAEESRHRGGRWSTDQLLGGRRLAGPAARPGSPSRTESPGGTRRPPPLEPGRAGTSGSVLPRAAGPDLPRSDELPAAVLCGSPVASGARAGAAASPSPSLSGPHRARMESPPRSSANGAEFGGNDARGASGAPDVKKCSNKACRAASKLHTAKKKIARLQHQLRDVLAKYSRVSKQYVRAQARLEAFVAVHHANASQAGLATGGGGAGVVSTNVTSR